MPTELSLVIGGVALPAFAAAVLWLLHKFGMSEMWDSTVSFVVALVFAGLVVTMHFFPQYDQTIVGAVAFLYTLIMTLEQILPDTVATVVMKARGEF